MEIKELTTKSTEYEEFVGHNQYSGILQSWKWGDFKSRSGWNPRRFILLEGGEIKLAAQTLSKNISFKKEILYIPEGPAVDWSDPEAGRYFNKFLVYLAANATGPNALFVRIDPFLSADASTGASALSIIKKNWFKKAPIDIQPRDTLILDLTKSEEHLLSQMHQKGRYNIKISEKKGIVVKEGIGEGALEAFTKLNDETASREKLAAHSGKYFNELFEIFTESEIKLFTAYSGSNALSSIVVLGYGKRATYLYGGSSRQERESMPNHAAQWHAIRWAKNAGYTSYDFWGVSPDESPKHPWAGISRFKRQFGGQTVHLIGAYDYPFNNILYSAMTQAEKAKKLISKIKR